MRGRAARPAVLLVLLVLLLLPGALAQPYVAGAGFDKPREVGWSSITTRFAFTATASGPFVHYTDNSGLHAVDVSEPAAVDELPAREIYSGRGVRQVASADVAGEPAVAYAYSRAGTFGIPHVVSWRGEERQLFEAHQAYELELLDLGGEPGLLYSRLEGGRHVLKLVTWDLEETIIYESEDWLAGYSAARAADGTLHLAWLEGYVEQGAIGGPQSEWSAYLGVLSPDGVVTGATELGTARNVGIESRTSITLVDGTPVVMWPGENGEVLAGSAGSPPVRIGVGSPLGLASLHAYWFDGHYVYRAALPPEVTGQQPAGEEDSDEAAIAVENVAWSPFTIETGEVATEGDHTFLAWYGPTRGLDYLVFATDNREAFQPGAMDRIAAALNWNPWNFWEAFVGQLFGSLFAGIGIAVLFAPLLWILASVFVGFGRRYQASTVGVVLGAVLLLLGAAGFAMVPIVRSGWLTPLLGTPLQLIACVLIAALLSWLLLRRSDAEPVQGMLAGGGMFIFLCASAIVFLTFTAWGEFWVFLNGGVT